jgi:hypothetical protein
MRAILQTGFGRPDVLVIRQIPEPEPKDGHAVIAVKASAGGRHPGPGLNRAASQHGVSDGINFEELRLVSAGVIPAYSAEPSYDDDRQGVVTRHENLPGGKSSLPALLPEPASAK